MESSGFVHLEPGASVRPAGLLAGWERFRVVHLAPQASEQLDPAMEHAVYVMRGDGDARLDATTVRLREGSALVLVRGTGATVVAGASGLEVFLIAVRP